MKVVIVGYGYWGPNLARNFANAAGSSLVAIVDGREARRQLASRTHPTAKVFGSIEELNQLTDWDAVVIATPPASHFALGMHFLALGKHILIEKPVTASYSEACTLNREAKKRGLTLMVDHTFLYTGAIQRLKHMIDSDELGQLSYYDSTRINLGLFQNDVNVLWDLAAHDLSILLYLVAERPSAVSAVGHAHLPNYKENIAYLTVYFPSNFIAHFHCSWVSPVKIRQVLVGGDRKMVVFNDMEPTEKLKIYDMGFRELSGEERDQILVDYRVGDVHIPKLSTREALSSMAEEFTKCVAQKKSPISNGDLGAAVVQILEASEKSIAQRGLPVELDVHGT